MRKQEDLTNVVEREILDRIADLTVAVARLEERILTKDAFREEAETFASKALYDKLEKKINLLALTGIFGTGTVIAADKIPAVSKILLSMLGG